MKLMKLKVDEHYLCLLKLRKKTQQAVCRYAGNIRKTPFFILIATQREIHQSKKAQRKNLAQAIY